MTDWNGYLSTLPELESDEETAIKQYLTHLDARKSENTLKNHRSTLKSYLQYLDQMGLGIMDADSLTIEDWVSHMLSQGYAPRSARVKSYAISSFYQRLQKRGYVEKNPVEDADGIKDLEMTRLEEHRDREYLTLDEYKQLRDAPDRLRDQLVIELLWNTGVRVSEAVNIRISDIDRDERSIEINNAKVERHASPETRTVYYTRRFARTLTKWLDNGGRDRYPGSHDADYLLVSKQHERMHDNRPNEIVDEAAQKAGIQEVLYTDQAGQERKRVNAHLLRKSYGVHRIRSDTGGGSMPLPYLQELMGHDDIQTTRDRYLQFRQDDVKTAERDYSPKT